MKKSTPAIWALGAGALLAWIWIASDSEQNVVPSAGDELSRTDALEESVTDGIVSTSEESPLTQVVPDENVDSSEAIRAYSQGSELIFSEPRVLGHEYRDASSEIALKVNRTTAFFNSRIVRVEDQVVQRLFDAANAADEGPEKVDGAFIFILPHGDSCTLSSISRAQGGVQYPRIKAECREFDSTVTAHIDDAGRAVFNVRSFPTDLQPLGASYSLVPIEGTQLSHLYETDIQTTRQNAVREMLNRRNSLPSLLAEIDAQE